jgi:hypothetical protein
VLALQTGKPLKRIPQDIVAATARQTSRGDSPGAKRHFAALKRILDRHEPDYAT